MNSNCFRSESDMLGAMTRMKQMKEVGQKARKMSMATMTTVMMVLVATVSAIWVKILRQNQHLKIMSKF